MKGVARTFELCLHTGYILQRHITQHLHRRRCIPLDLRLPLGVLGIPHRVVALPPRGLGLQGQK